MEKHSGFPCHVFAVVSVLGKASKHVDLAAADSVSLCKLPMWDEYSQAAPRAANQYQGASHPASHLPPRVLESGLSSELCSLESWYHKQKLTALQRVLDGLLGADEEIQVQRWDGPSAPSTRQSWSWPGFLPPRVVGSLVWCCFLAGPSVLSWREVFSEGSMLITLEKAVELPLFSCQASLLPSFLNFCLVLRSTLCAMVRATFCKVPQPPTLGGLE